MKNLPSKNSGFRLALLWTHWSGYIESCTQALRREFGAEILFSVLKSDSQAPFSEPDASDPNVMIHAAIPDYAAMSVRIAAFRPHVVLSSSWHIGPYRKILRDLRGKAVRAAGMDNQWHGNPKQILGILTSPVYLKPIFDCAFVSGDRQRRFANFLGFKNKDIYEPYYSCDVASFTSRSPNFHVKKSFIFVGRLVPEKGIRELIEAYRIYRQAAKAAAWDLKIAGTGPLRSLIKQEDGIVYLGFRPPQDLPAILAEAHCLVLPSYRENWGVVLHEAASAALPIICTKQCGASDKFVATGLNGVLLHRSDPTELAEAMSSIASKSETELEQMSAESRARGMMITPSHWARAIAAMAERRQETLDV